MAEGAILELRNINKSFGAVDVLEGRRLPRQRRVRSPRSSVTTAPASRRWSSASRARTRSTRATTCSTGRSVRVHSPRDASAPRDRDRVPGPRAVRQPRRRPEHVPRPRARPRHRARREQHGAVGGGDAEVAVGPHAQVGAAARVQPVRRAAADGRDRQGRAVELEGRRPRRADRRARASRRPRRCSTWCAASPTAVSPSC